MKTEKEYQKAVSIIRRLVSNYSYVAEECQNNKGKPCKRCAAILHAKKFLSENK